MNSKTIFTIDDVSKILGISKTTCYKIAQDADFPSIRISRRRIIVPKQQFMIWLDKKTQKMSVTPCK